IGKIAKAGEEIEDDVEALARNRLPHVALEPVKSNAIGPGALFRHLQEEGGQVDAGDVIATACQLNRVPALAAREIEDAERRPQGKQGFEPIDLDRCPLSQIIVVEGKVPRPEPTPPPFGIRLHHPLYIRASTTMGEP